MDIDFAANEKSTLDRKIRDAHSNLVGLTSVGTIAARTAVAKSRVTARFARLGSSKYIETQLMV
jgi:hypothetical protein